MGKLVDGRNGVGREYGRDGSRGFEDGLEVRRCLVGLKSCELVVNHNSLQERVVDSDFDHGNDGRCSGQDEDG